MNGKQQQEKKATGGQLGLRQRTAVAPSLPDLSWQQKTVLQWQRQQGNAYVQRRLAPGVANIQRDCPPDCPREPRRRVPGLDDDLVMQVEDAIDNSNPQGAINLVVNALAAQGRINTSELEGGIMRYSASMTDEGHTTSYWDKDPATHPDAKMLPFAVTIGPAALSDVPWLYATVIHEWRHVQQFRVPQAMADRDAATEADAYLNGIEQAWASGLTTEQVTELWTRLRDDHWSRLTDPTIRANLQPRYDAAQAYVNSFTTSGLAPRVFQRLHFAQVFFATGQSKLDSTANDEIGVVVDRANLLRSDHPDYDMRWTITGFASPRWQHPRRGEMPADLNQALSQQRADTVLAQIQNAFRATGDGACDFRIQTCVPQTVTVDDPTWDSLARGQGSGPALAEGRDLNSDDQQDRRVDILVEFSPGPRVPTQPPSWLGGGGGGV